MCTVTYIPLEDQFIFTSNRDEDPRRAVNYVDKEGEYYYPKDPRANGTWFIVQPNKRLRCLLNGAFEKHKHLPPYARSRGIMVLDSMNYETLEEFKSTYDFKGIEPFTFIEVYFGNGHIEISEVRWDEKDIHFKNLDSSAPQIWSSSPLYNKEQTQVRKSWFDELIRSKPEDADNILSFHESQLGDDPANYILMRRNPGPMTISTTMYDNRQKRIYHKNQLTQEVQWIEFS